MTINKSKSKLKKSLRQELILCTNKGKPSKFFSKIEKAKSNKMSNKSDVKKGNSQKIVYSNEKEEYTKEKSVIAEKTLDHYQANPPRQCLSDSLHCFGDQPIIKLNNMKNNTSQASNSSCSIFSKPDDFGTNEKINWSETKLSHCASEIYEDKEAEPTLNDPIMKKLFPFSPAKSPLKESRNKDKQDKNCKEGKRKTKDRKNEKEKNRQKNSQQSQKTNQQPVRILSRPKFGNWETFNINSIRTKLKDNDIYIIQLDDDYQLCVDRCKIDRTIIFCQLQKIFNKDSKPFAICAYALFKLEMSDSDIRNGVKELYDEIELLRDGDTQRMINNFSRPVLDSLKFKVIEQLIPAFPEAVYYCSTCDYHLNNILHLKSHIEERKHIEILEITKEREDFYKGTPPLLPNHSLAINKLLENSITTSETDKEKELFLAEEIRLEILDRMKHISLFQDKEITLKLFGSVLCGTSNSDSDFNFYWNIEMIDAEMLLDMKKAVETDFMDEENVFKNFSDISLFVNTRRIRVFLTYKRLRKVTLEWRVDHEVALFELIQVYTKHSPKVITLIKAIRNWANTCDLLSPNGLSKRTFDIMVIHYLQQNDKLLIIPKDTKEVPAEEPIDFDVAQEYVSFFGYYSQKLKSVVQIEQKEPMWKEENKWSNKMLQIKNPYANEDNMVQFQRTFQPHFLNCMFITFVYFSVPRNKERPVCDITWYSPSIERNTKKVHEEKEKATSLNKKSETLPNKEEKAISLANDNETVENDINEEGKTGSPKKGIEKSVNEEEEMSNYLKDDDQMLEVDENEEEKQRESAALEETADSNEDKSMSDIERREVKEAFDNCVETIIEAENRVEVLEASEIGSNGVYDKETVFSIRKVTEQKNKDLLIRMLKYTETDALQDIITNKAVIEKYEANAVRTKNPSKKPVMKSFDDIRIRCEQWPLKDYYLSKNIQSWKVEDFCYSLDDVKNFTLGFVGDVRCVHCDKSSHASAECPDMKMPEIVEINYTKGKEEREYLDKVIYISYHNLKITDNVRKDVNRDIQNMQEAIRKQFPDARLQLFGSMENGFGTANSDADICLRFKHDTPPENEDVEKIINSVAKILKRDVKLNTMVIMGAKVPIVKFKTNKNNRVLEGDISYYNTLALVNTKLLKTYTEWDQRVAPLGIWIKKWAKILDIGDASRGSLSSYSYIVMLIHYLQNCEPPVLPRLQEVKLGDVKLHNGYDVYFSEEVIPNWTKNTDSLGELFIGFLDYYSRFDYQNLVIQIRRAKPLTKLEKSWNRPISLEDPFDLKHNLGSVVNLRMFCHIRKTIIRSREIFMNKIQINQIIDPKQVERLIKSCNPGLFPFSQRACYFCFKHGHVRENCPRRLEQEKLYNISNGSEKKRLNYRALNDK